MYTAEEIAEVLVEANAALILARERTDLPVDIRNNLVAAVLSILVLEGRRPQDNHVPQTNPQPVMPEPLPVEV
jgi:hypothetical protein